MSNLPSLLPNSSNMRRARRVPAHLKPESTSLGGQFTTREAIAHDVFLHGRLGLEVSRDQVNDAVYAEANRRAALDRADVVAKVRPAGRGPAVEYLYMDIGYEIRAAVIAALRPPITAHSALAIVLGDLRAQHTLALLDAAGFDVVRRS